MSIKNKEDIDNIKVTIDYETDITKYSLGIRRKVATRFETREDILDILSNDPNEIIRSRVAKNISTSKETLLKLTKDESTLVKASILKNKNLSKDVFNELVNDEHYSVKLGIINSPFVTNDMLQEYMKDNEKRVRIISELKLNNIEIKNKLNLHTLEIMTPSYQAKLKKKIKQPIVKSIETIEVPKIEEKIEFLQQKEEKIKKVILPFPKIDVLSDKALISSIKKYLTAEERVLILKNYKDLSFEAFMKIKFTLYKNSRSSSYYFNDKSYTESDIDKLIFKHNSFNSICIDKYIDNKQDYMPLMKYKENDLSFDQLKKMFLNIDIVYPDKKQKNYRDKFPLLLDILNSKNTNESLVFIIIDYYKKNKENFSIYGKSSILNIILERFNSNKSIQLFLLEEIKDFINENNLNKNSLDKHNYVDNSHNFITFINKFIEDKDIIRESIEFCKTLNKKDFLISLRKNSTITKEDLNEILNSNSLEFKDYLSTRRDTPINILEKLSKDVNMQIQMKAYNLLEILFEEYDRGELDLDR